METFGMYLLKSAVWLTGFTLVFLTVLRNERYFRLNRIYLLAGIIASVTLPFYTWHYAVITPSATGTISISGLSAQVIDTSTPSIPIYYWFYAMGIGWLAFRLIWQTGKVIRKLRKAGYEVSGPVKLVRTPEYAASFSFFSYVFVNPSTSDVETREIVNHESEHIRQRHWFDLLLAEILCMLQWFNPFVWVYGHLIRQNHEYLADEKALLRTSDPAIYQATLLNQLFGVPVISLANSFSYSLNKKRFKMMKKSIHSPIRKLKLLLVIPLMALVFYAFAKPEYMTSQEAASKTDQMKSISDGQNSQTGTVKGKVINPDGKPLTGASVIIKGTTQGTITDEKGNFKLKEVPKDGELVFSFVGYESFQTKPDFDQSMLIKMKTGIISVDKVTVSGKEPSINKALYVVDGTIVPESFVKAMDPEKFKSINVLKGEQATTKYGEKGANGVIEVTLKKELPDSANTDSAKKDSIVNALDPLKAPIFMLDGVMIEKSKADKVYAGGVESITIWKGKDATDKYGEKGENGVIEMISKKESSGSSTSDSYSKILQLRSGNSKNLPLYVLDGKPIDKAKMETLKPELIQSVNVLNDKTSTDKYGEKGKYGVVEIILKGNDTGSNESKSNNQPKPEVFDVKNPPLFVVDGVATSKANFDKKLAEGVESGKTLRGKEATDKYGEKGKNGVVEIFLKENRTTDSQVNDSKVFKIVEEMPQFPGGHQAMMKYIGANVKYPAKATLEKAEGMVVVNFVIKSTGKVEEVKVVRGVHPALDAEALRVINNMPDWQPGKQHGEAVDVSYTIPIQFKLH